jgi:hypothetical protein
LNRRRVTADHDHPGIYLTARRPYPTPARCQSVISLLVATTRVRHEGRVAGDLRAGGRGEDAATGIRNDHEEVVTAVIGISP